MENLTSDENVAQKVIKKCGGVSVVARITKRAESSIYKWTYPKDKGGTDGLIPSEAQAMLMDAANRGEVALTPADFFKNAD